MRIEVPADALDRVQDALSSIASYTDNTNVTFLLGNIRKLAAFADHFARHPLPGMQFSHIVGSESALHITEPSLPMIDLIKINGRNFVPEVAEAVDMHIATPVEIYREMLAECAVRFREYERGHRAKSRAAADKGAPDLKALDKAERNAAIARRIEGILSGLETPQKDEEELRFERFVERVAAFTDEELLKVDARQFRHIAQVVIEGAAPEYPDFAHMPPNPLPDDVRALVIAAREVWEANDDRCEEWDALDKALEAFSARVPYENEPEDVPGSIGSTFSRWAIPVDAKGFVRGFTMDPDKSFTISADKYEVILDASKVDEVVGTVPGVARVNAKGEILGFEIAAPMPAEVKRGPAFKWVGKLPEWLARDGKCSAMVGVGDGEGCIRSMYLPADHPYYLATSRGFTYWPGGENAPEDWDSSKEVLFRKGDSYVGRLWKWKRGHYNPSDDIIGYHKRPAAEAIANSAKISLTADGKTAIITHVQGAPVPGSEMTFGAEVRGTFEDRQRAQKIDSFAIGASEDDISAFINSGCDDKAKARVKARYDFAFDMMAERENRGLK